ncbi:Multidrug resistance-associated protein 4 [Linnemannia schmuckeri]|uniref:Multidrug resistance-associated protein 4 n=1 Tax=Linnemannia schmuckeri TaxID=64567 RepID=A0A9P5S5Y0_9FUNG|nr:Multidrug resistance-associated protein 4 [Linnemannia schmuckeri]
MPYSRSNRRNTTYRYRGEQDSTSSLSVDPIVLKGGHSFNFVSQWFFLWVIPLLRRTRSDPDFDPDAIELQQEESAQYAGERLGERWRQEELDFKEKASVSRALMSAFGRPYLMLAFYKVFWIIFTYVGSYFLVKQLITYVETTPLDQREATSSRDGYLYALGLFLTCVGSSICIQQVMAECTRIGVQVRAGLMVLIYRKSLKLSSAHGGIGNIINLLSNDCNRVAESFVNFHFLWSSALEIIVVIALAFVELKLAAVPALIILVLLFPVQYLLSFYTARVNAMATNSTTARIHIMSELLTAIKLIKFYAWEPYFRDRVTRVRAKEMDELRRGMYLKITSFALVFAAPVVTTLACICVYELSDDRGLRGDVTSSVVFTSLSLFNTLRYPLIMLPIAVKTTLGAMLSFERLNGFLSLPEVEPLQLHGDSDTMPESDKVNSTGASVVADGLVMNGSNSSSGDAKEMERLAHQRELAQLRIYIKDADFGWPESKESNPTLKFISMKIKPGDLVAIVGDVGSGKSSTLAAIMGQIRLMAGSRAVRGTLAYVPHDAWLLNATAKENILFGSPFNQEKYNAILRVCALNRDMSLLSAGDETEIGERGINLSQGQRQRVSLARAVYSGADIMLLDDPLSGMDAQIGKHIFQECIKGYLASKTVVYVTNQLQHLASCDYIIVMKAGSVEAQGTFTELMAQDVNLARIVDESMEIEDPDQIQELTNEVRLEAPVDDTGAGATSPPTSPASEKGSTQALPLSRTIGLSRGNTGKGRFSSDEKNSEIAELSTVTVHGLPSIVRSGKLTHAGTSSVHNRPHLLSQRSQSASGTGTASTTFNTAANEQTIHRIREMNAHTIQNQMINEQTISRMIERNQMTILGNMGQNRLTVHATNREENSMARAVERNQLTIHSLSGREGGMLSGGGGRGERLDLGFGVKSRDVVSGWSVAKAYLRKGTGMGVSIAVALVFLATHGLRIFSDYWLRFTVGPDAKPDFNYYLSVYGGLVAAVVFGAYMRTFFLSWVVFRKSITYHDRIFRKIMRAPMSYFDVTPLARILNAFARHQYVVDEVLPDAILQMLQYMPLAIGAAILVIAIVPWSVIAVVVLLGLVWVLVHFSSYADDRLKSMEAMTKGPIFAHMAATLDGLFSIRVYGAEERFDAFNLSKIDDNHKALFAMMQIRSWLALYLDLVSSIFVLVTAMFVIYFSRDNTLDASQAGLAITNALQLLIFGQWSIRMASEVKSTKESVCQLELYGMNIPAEAPDVIPENQPPANWPSQGEIEFKKVVLRYQNYGVAVLKKVDFLVQARQKIGVVGKMGSGKTTLLISLLRVVEAAEGQILIDNVDIREIGLQDLRSKIAIIPQEPVLFVGTIRSNLDPFHRRNDQEIWDALDAVHLSENIKLNMPLKLETPIIENGRNFSLGQRQLFCIARAILFQSRILVLDEATSAVDLQTDLLIQETIKKNFADCTVLMIAHRLNTIMECDKILVMEDGRVVEFEHPTKLIENKDGYFYSLVNQSGPDSVTRLKTMLREHGHTVDGEPPIVVDQSASRRAGYSAGLTGAVPEVDEEDEGSYSGSGSGSGSGVAPVTGSSSQKQHSTKPSFSGKSLVEESLTGSRSSSASNLDGRGMGNAGEESVSSLPGMSSSVVGSASPMATIGSTSAHPMPKSLEDVFAPRSTPRRDN